MADLLWPALALMLVLEGILPLVAPAAWRRVFQQMTALNDGQIRFFGLVSVGLGALALWAVS